MSSFANEAVWHLSWLSQEGTGAIWTLFCDFPGSWLENQVKGHLPQDHDFSSDQHNQLYVKPPTPTSIKKKKNNLQTLWNFFLYFCIITQVCFLLVGEQFQSLCKSTNPNTNHPKLSLYIINQSKYTSCCRPIKTAQIKPKFRGQPIRNCDK